MRGGWPWALLLVVALLVLGRAWLFDLRRLGSASMSPTLEAGDLVLLRRVGPVRPGDLVLLHLGQDPERYVKRVVAGPGAEVEEVGGHLLVDGAPLATGEVASGELRLHCRQQAVALVEEASAGRAWQVVEGGGSTEPVTVPPGHWFMAGDERAASRDSRHWGPVSAQEVDGVLLARLPGPDPCTGQWRRGRLLIR